MMTDAEIIEKTSINLVEVKQELETIKKRDEELDIRGNKAEEYVLAFTQLSKKNAEELCKDIEKLNVPRLKDQHINKIIDIMPMNEAHLKMVLQGFTLTVNQENIKKINSVVQKYKK